MNQKGIGCHSAPGYALRSVSAVNTRQKSTLNNPFFCLDNPGHFKVGIFVDSADDIVAIHGSFNDSARGSLNGEAFSVFKSWDTGQYPYVTQHFSRLLKLWNHGNSQFNMVLLPDAIRDEIVSKRQYPKPYDADQDTLDTSRYDFVREEPEIQLRPYQDEAIAKWQTNNCQGILEMATGTGKTYTALSAAVSEQKKRKRLAIIILVPYLHLLEQWQLNCEKFGLYPILCSGNHSNWNREVRSRVQDYKLGLLPNLCILAVHQTSASDKFSAAIKDLPPETTLLIADEVHRLGSSNLRNALTPNADLRIGLSATPYRWYDDDGTKALMEYFNGVCFEFTLGQAIGKYLTPYRYFPILTQLTDSEKQEYEELSARIAVIVSRQTEIDVNNDDALRMLLLKRTRILSTAENKLPLLLSALRHQMNLAQETGNEIRDVLVYCAPGTHKEVLSSVSSLGLSCHEFVHKVSLKKRSAVLDQFAKGDIQVLIAIKCLDEGVDIPSTRVAYFLSSTTNPKEFIQRRGRILRMYKGKSHSDVFDFIIVPDIQDACTRSNNDLSILKREMPRFAEFAEYSSNEFEARSKVLDILDAYQVLHLIDKKPWEIYHDVMETIEIRNRS